jgi:uncharacterized membrane protein
MPNQNLNTYRVLFLVYGILTFVFSLFFLAYAGFGFFFHEMIENESQNDMPFNVGSIFIVIGAIGFVFALIVGILTILASNYIKALKNYNFIFAMAIVNCLTGILGILLGIFALIELNKPETRALFYNTDDKS